MAILDDDWRKDLKRYTGNFNNKQAYDRNFTYDPKRYVNPSDFGKPWYSTRRSRWTPNLIYQPLDFNSGLMEDIENRDYFNDFFTRGIFENPDEPNHANITLNEIGRAWATEYDKNHPTRSRTIFDENGNIRNNWLGLDGKNFTNVYDYIQHLSHDHLAGLGHNIFLPSVTRYYYMDDGGNRKYINIGLKEEDIKKRYKVESRPDEYGDNNLLVHLYELTGLLNGDSNGENDNTPGNENSTNVNTGTSDIYDNATYRFEVLNTRRQTGLNDDGSEPGGNIGEAHKEGKGSAIQRIRKSLGRIKNFNKADMAAALRLGTVLDANSRIYKNAMAAIRPDLLKTYRTHYQVTGNKALQQANYDRASELNTKALRPITSDADRQLSYILESQKQGDKYKIQGNIADNEAIEKSRLKSFELESNNIARANDVANKNAVALNQHAVDRAKIKNKYISALYSTIENTLKGYEFRERERQKARNSIMLSRRETEINEKYEDLYNSGTVLHEVTKLKTNPDGSLVFEDKDGKIPVMETTWEPVTIDGKPATYTELATKIDALLRKQEKGETLTDAEYQTLVEYNRYLREYIKLLNRRRSRELNDAILESDFVFRRGGRIKVSGSGTKIVDKTTTKTNNSKNAELLYKSTRDTVKHFEEMTKPSRSRRRKPPKALPLKYEDGGLTPFLIYTPLPYGGSDTSTTKGGSRSSWTNGGGGSGKKQEEGKLDEVIKQLLGHLEGLPSDVDKISRQLESDLRTSSLLLQNPFSPQSSINTGDLEIKAIRAIRMANLAKFNQDQFNKAVDVAKEKDGLNEYATDAYGNLIVQNEKGNISRMEYEEYMKNQDKLNPLTNKQVADLRAYYPMFANNSSLIEVVSNATSMDAINKRIKEIPLTIGTNENTRDFLRTKQEIAEIQKVQKGFDLLTGDSEEGIYKLTHTTKTLKEQINAALEYVWEQLNPNERTVLKIHSGGRPKELLYQLFLAGEKSTDDFRLSYDTAATNGQKDPATGRKPGEEDLSIVSQMIQEKGGRNGTMILRPGGNQANGNGYRATLQVNVSKYTALPNVNGDMSLQQMLSDSGIKWSLQGFRGITFGDQPLSSDNLKDVMFIDGEDKAVATLPMKHNSDGSITVDFSVLEDFLEVLNKTDKQAELKGIDHASEEYKKLFGKNLKESGLTELVGADGLPSPRRVGQFLIVYGYTSDRVIKEGAGKFIDRITNSDELLSIEDRMIRALSTDKDKSNYQLDVRDHGIFELTYDEVYKAPIFIPLTNNFIASQNAGKIGIKPSRSEEYERDYQNYILRGNANEFKTDVLQ